ncbi:MAG: PspC domain-containing protein [Cytophagales bacterium]|nr:PspC domain-containing protein [Cytophagales bacterium]MCA6367858.1 PspC domain-containing protein [Cytophagales bacterium]MCA6371033.1 PspC domain-containing protein [Cytophagales bacterium]MCA6377179.1 PspC domain-containing protein [Cytophagales bacterium]MCA6384656.1 PspC domain-containing protein [Cytophagales bacterium]
MKKNISINISGIIFHIEEDGYESLRKYLDSINRYFGSFEDSSEILSDIESRIAEIFLSRLNEGKQVITLEDVNSLIATMGNVNDFKAAEEQEIGDESPKAEHSRQESTTRPSAADTAHKKLFRDEKRKILGGVCAGLGHYFSVDPVWPRVLFALLVLGSYGGLFLAYIILWIVIPNSTELPDDASIKKMYRDPEKKVLGGVASGVAAFFGVDVTVIRVLFIVFAFLGGLGLLLYIILWIALPEAKSITEKMEMQGEPVTLSNIESTVKKSLNEKEEEESTLTKIVLFPFRLIATFITALGKILGPLVNVLVEFIRVIFGLVIFFIGLALLVGIVITGGILLGFFTTAILPDYWGGGEIQGLSLPTEAIRNTFPVWSMVAAFTVVLIPSLAILLSGSSILAKRSIVNQPVSWIMLGLFVTSVLVLSFTVPKMVYSFKEEGEFKVEKTFAHNGKTPVLKLKEVGMDNYNVTELNLKGYEGSELKLVQRFKSQGFSRKNGAENAQMVTYSVLEQDSSLVFDSNIAFKKDAKFRAQRLEMDLFIPYGQTFLIEEDLWRIIENDYHDYDGYRDSNMNKIWKMTDHGFECTNCSEPTETKQLQLNDQYGFKDFNEIEMTGIFDLVIARGDAFSVQLDGPQKEKRKYEVDATGETLDIRYRSRSNTFWEKGFDLEDRVKINITLPHLTKLKIKGAGQFRIRGFDEEEMDITLLGAMTGDADLRVRSLTLDLAGPMVLQLDGEGHFLDAEVKKLSQLKAGQYQVEDAVVEARGMGRARINASQTVDIDTDAVSSVKYTGEPRVTRRD